MQLTGSHNGLYVINNDACVLGGIICIVFIMYIGHGFIL